MKYKAVELPKLELKKILDAGFRKKFKNVKIVTEGMISKTIVFPEGVLYFVGNDELLQKFQEFERNILFSRGKILEQLGDGERGRGATRRFLAFMTSGFITANYYPTYPIDGKEEFISQTSSPELDTTPAPPGAPLN